MSDVNTLLDRAKSALIAHDYSLAAKIFKNLIMEAPDNLDYKMQLGNLYTKAGKDDQALTIFQQVEKADPANFEARIAISGIYRRQQKYEESVTILKNALETCEENQKTRAKISYNLGFTYRLMGKYDEAIQCFEEVVEENPSDVLANNHLGAIYALQGKHTKAIEAYNRGLKFDANHPILQFNIAKSYAEIGERAKALNFFEGALRAKPGWTDAIEAYADLLLNVNKVSEADEIVNQALKLNPDDVKIHTAKGNIFNRQSIFEDAEVEYKKALDVDEGYRNALTGLAHALESQGKTLDAVEVISHAEKLNPNDVKLIKQSASIHISANDFGTALAKIEKLQETDKNDVQTLNLLGQYYICTGSNEKAEECFTRIKKINPDYNEVYRDWGRRFVQIGDEKRSEPYLQAAIQKNPKDAIAMVYLGELYEKQNQLGKALQLYKKASNADSFNHRSKAASERIIGDDDSLASIDFSGNSGNSVDYDSLFSGGKLDSETTEPEVETEVPENLPETENSTDSVDSVDSADVTAESANSNEEEKPLEADELVSDEMNFDEIAESMGDSEPAEEENELSEEQNTEEENPAEESEEKSENVDFNMEMLADPEADSENLDSVAEKMDDNMLENEGEQLLETEDLAEPVFAEESENSDYAENGNGESEVVEVETPAAARKEISDDSLDMLEAQIKRAAELAEKANYAAQSAWEAASQAADAAQAAEEAKKIETLAVNELKLQPEIQEEIPEETQEESEPEVQESEVDEEVLTEEETLPEPESQKSNIEEEFHSEEEIQLEPEPEPRFETEIEEDEKETVAESEKTVENIGTEEILEDDMQEETAEKTVPKVDDLTLRRAIDMLPSIIAAIEDRSLLYRFRSFLSMFKSLREMLEFLPDEQRNEFMTSQNRLLLDYVISKLSGKPGLYATTKALIRSGLIHENKSAKPTEKEGLELVKEVLGDLRELSESLEDETLRIVLNNEADTLEKAI
ncbi:tetratricopeptide repeat protein [uncultured Treponema sp.]|uniref:tetratricopeptide repeat protein n=1 Tax=uncultured Treponema sp. TaxID=162155 RepID=UPI0025ED98CA|nr:tetratricopeptide repeat protein [uncultured Treponema sp.]